ncbi:hypothetical protein MSP8886_00266 [Marinomonas spartinae]|uniref:Uncharacterized protein n=1 Tax=Marinomonas spartinae TaxID=1792290 RepID=A0A1A8T195_9GAMM|nr:AHH domain-containing protein [Marinomonas spartinae]SBS25392.1 hypothetical protein MSP8886_00266 [Marinomonas spartinae]
MSLLRTYPKPERPNDPTHLEMAIYNYELKAKAHHDQRLKETSSDKEQQAKMQRDFDHLQKEKQRLLSIAIARESLEGYRTYTEKANIEQLEYEEHHPTEKLARLLTSQGEFKPTINHEAHHIVPGKGRYQQARLTLYMWGIGINDPMNGVWLLNYKKNKPDDWATAKSVPHRNLHRYNYETWIGERFAIASSRKAVEARLRQVKDKIKNNAMPVEVMSAKDANWSGTE